MAKVGTAVGLIAAACGGGLPVESDGTLVAAPAATGLAGASTGEVDGQPLSLTGGSTATSTGGDAGESDAGDGSTGGTPECASSPGLTRQCWAQNFDQTWCQGVQMCRDGRWTVCDCSAVVSGSGGTSSSGGSPNLTGGQSPSGGSVSPTSGQSAGRIPYGGAATGVAGTGGSGNGGTRTTGGKSAGGAPTGGSSNGGSVGSGGTAGSAGIGGQPPVRVTKNVGCPGNDATKWIRVSVEFPDTSWLELSMVSILVNGEPRYFDRVAVRDGLVEFNCWQTRTASVTLDPALVFRVANGRVNTIPCGSAWSPDFSAPNVRTLDCRMALDGASGTLWHHVVPTNEGTIVPCGDYQPWTDGSMGTLNCTSETRMWF